MLTPSSRRGNLLTVTFLLLLATLFEQYGIAPFFPLTNAAGSFRLMIVFLDIPLALPDIDWLPVSILFTILYCVAVGPRLSRAEQPLGRWTWKALSGWWLFLACTAAGGGIYYLVQNYLPKQVNNGIDSFGVRADLTLPWPSGEIIHLHGSMFMLVFALLGGYIMARRAAFPAAVGNSAMRTEPEVLANPGIRAVGSAKVAVGSAVVRSAGVATGSAAVAEAQAIINSPVPPVKAPVIKEPAKVPAREPVRVATSEVIKVPAREPVLAGEPEPPATWTPTKRRSSISVTMPATRPGQPQKGGQTQTAAQPPAQGPAFPGEAPTCRLTTPPPIAMVMPRPAPGIGKVHPCIVIGSLKPTASK